MASPPIAFSIKHLIQVDSPTEYSCKREPTVLSNCRSQLVCPGSAECDEEVHSVCIVRPLPVLRILVDALDLRMTTNMVLDGTQWVSTTDVLKRENVLIPEDGVDFILEAFRYAVAEDVKSWNVCKLVGSAMGCSWDFCVDHEDPISDEAARLSVRTLFEFYHNASVGYIDFGPHKTLKSAVSYCVDNRASKNFWAPTTVTSLVTADERIADLQSLVIRLTQKIDELTSDSKKDEKHREKKKPAAKEIIVMDSDDSKLVQLGLAQLGLRLIVGTPGVWNGWISGL